MAGLPCWGRGWLATRCDGSYRIDNRAEESGAVSVDITAKLTAFGTTRMTPHRRTAPAHDGTLVYDAVFSRVS